MTQDDLRGKSKPVLAATEAEALNQLRGLAQSYAVELWDGGRLIASVPLARALKRLMQFPHMVLAMSRDLWSHRCGAWFGGVHGLHNTDP